MRTEAVVFLSSLLVALACSAIPGFSDCNCPTEASPPEPMGPFGTDFQVTFWAGDGTTEVGPVQPSRGNLEVTDSLVIINYVQDNVTHRVEYRIFPD